MSAERAQPQRRTIALIGLRGSGKTTVGRILADLLHGQCVDVDEVILRESGRPRHGRACGSIREIFEIEGEEGFRRRERDAIAAITVSPPAVMSVGGGAVLDESNRNALARVATVVWLTAPAQVLWERVSSDPATVDSRPPLSELNGLAELEKLATQRRETYEESADLVVDTEGRSPSQVARAIIEGLGYG